MEQKTHPGLKSYTYQYCKKSFSNSSLCKQREQTHTGEKTYTCEHCKKSFSYSLSCLEVCKMKKNRKSPNFARIQVWINYFSKQKTAFSAIRYSFQGCSGTSVSPAPLNALFEVRLKINKTGNLTNEKRNEMKTFFEQFEM